MLQSDGSILTELSNKQPLHAALTSISNLNTPAGKILYTENTNDFKDATLTEFARQILDDTNAVAVRNTIDALGKSEKAKDSEKADLAARSTADANGNIITTSYAPINNPVFTGIPQVPTPTDITTSTAQIASTEFVRNNIADLQKSNANMLAEIERLFNILDSEDGGGVISMLNSKQDVTKALTSISGQNAPAGRMLYTVDTDTYTTTPFTGLAKNLMDDETVAEMRNTIDALGKSEKAADSNKLNGQPATYYATATDLNNAITNLVGAAPELLNTLEELANAINKDANVYNTLNSAIAQKQNKHAALTSISGLNTDVYEEATSGSSTSSYINQFIYTNAKDTYTTGNIYTVGVNALGAKDASSFRTVIEALGKNEKAVSAEQAVKDGQGNVIASTYAKVANPLFTGDPKVQRNGNNLSLATKEDVNIEIAGVNSNINTVSANLNKLIEGLGVDVEDLSSGQANLTESIEAKLAEKQNKHAALTSISNLNPAANKFLYTTQQNTFTTANITSTGISLLGSTSAAAARTAIGAMGQTDTIEKATKDALGHNINDYYMPKAYTNGVTIPIKNWEKVTYKSNGEEDISLSKWKADIADNSNTVPEDDPSTENVDDMYYTIVEDSNITSNDMVDVIINRNYQMTANEANLYPTNESYNGYFVVTAQRIPKGEIGIIYYVFATKGNS